ncbi:MAG: hypothetical protein LBI43_02565 [Streptococcaceae bacterium]|jgi:hypothetical protein|nr:hypothetical protein [Streptococcaceae bacterium]
MKFRKVVSTGFLALSLLGAASVVSSVVVNASTPLTKRVNGRYYFDKNRFTGSISNFNYGRPFWVPQNAKFAYCGSPYVSSWGWNYTRYAEVYYYTFAGHTYHD